MRSKASSCHSGAVQMTIERYPLRHLLLATLVLLACPAQAGDLGVYDELLPGVNAKVTNENQRIFDAWLGQIAFTPEKLTFHIQPNSRDTKALLSGRLEKFLDTGEQGYLTPDQIISYQSFFGGGATHFSILYTTRAGEKSMIGIGFVDGNTAMSFHKVFLLWWNKKLP